MEIWRFNVALLSYGLSKNFAVVLVRKQCECAIASQTPVRDVKEVNR